MHARVTKKSMNLLSIAQFLEEVEEGGVVCALMACEESAKGDVSVELQEMVSKFANLMSEDLPLGLPLVSNIKHLIEFVLGSSLPNHQAYYFSLKES